MQLSQLDTIKSFTIINSSRFNYHSRQSIQFFKWKSGSVCSVLLIKSPYFFLSLFLSVVQSCIELKFQSTEMEIEAEREWKKENKERKRKNRSDFAVEMVKGYFSSLLSPPYFHSKNVKYWIE